MTQLDTVARIALSILACYRLARLLVVEDGPGDIFKRIRTLAGTYHRTVYNKFTPQEYEEANTALGRLFDCQHCMGVWAALALVVLVALPSIPGDMFIILLAISGGQSWLTSKVD